MQKRRKERKAWRGLPSSSVLFRPPDLPTGFCFLPQLPGSSAPPGRVHPRERVLLQSVRREPPPQLPAEQPPLPQGLPPGGSSAQRNESAGLAPGASSSQHHHLPPTADLRLHAMDHRPGRAGCGMQGVQGQPCSPSGEIPAAGRIVEPRGQAWPSGTRGHPIHRGPGPSNTHHTEP